MITLHIRLFLTLTLICIASLASAQFKTTLINQQGATAPCVGIGPVGGPLAKKCVDYFVQAGFIREDEVGSTGITVGTKGKEDGVITAVAAGSPAAVAGLQVGDVIRRVGDNDVRLTPGVLAEKALFGVRGSSVHLKVRRNGSDVEMDVTRDAKNAPAGPKSPNFFIVMKPMINWRGQFVPCMGAGPAAMGAVEYCYGHFKPFGFVKVGEFGSTGFEVDEKNADKAVVSSVEANSAAAKAGVMVGDEILEVDGKPLVEQLGEEANEMLFGKVGDTLHVTVKRKGGDVGVDLKLVAKGS